MRWPWQKPARKRLTKASLAAAGVRTESDATYRRERIDSYLSLMSDRSPAKATELEEFLDKWVIHKVDGTEEHSYLPAPSWDDEFHLTRDSYPTLSEAKAAVAEVGGTLFAGRGLTT